MDTVLFSLNLFFLIVEENLAMIYRNTTSNTGPFSQIDATANPSQNRIIALLVSVFQISFDRTIDYSRTQIPTFRIFSKSLCRARYPGKLDIFKGDPIVRKSSSSPLPSQSLMQDNEYSQCVPVSHAIRRLIESYHTVQPQRSKRA